MEFALTDEQALLHDSARRYLDEAYGFEARRAIAASSGGFSAAQWSAFSEMGWLGLALPESVGGLGQGAAELALLHQALGHALVLEPLAEVAVRAGQALALAGPAALDDAAAIAAGHARLVSTASGLAIPGRLLQARPGGRWQLDGRTALLRGAAHADAYLVAARGPDDGLQLFRVAAGTPGLRCEARRLIDGSAAGRLLFDGVVARAPLVEGEMAARALAAAAEWSAVAACAEALGVMERAFGATREYLLQRQQFGVALASFQALRHRLADMAIAIEQARAALHTALAVQHEGDPAQRSAILRRAADRVARSGRFVTAHAIQLHGGMGMSDECIVGHCFKRLLVLEHDLGAHDAGA